MGKSEKRRILSASLAAVLIFGLAAAGQAGSDYTWTNAKADNNWENGANWEDAAGEPADYADFGRGDSMYINKSGREAPILKGRASEATTDPLRGHPVLGRIGSIHVGNAEHSSKAGELILKDDAALWVGKGDPRAFRVGYAGGAGRVNQVAGAVNASFPGVQIGVGSGSIGVYNLTGGSFVIGRYGLSIGTDGGTGEFNISGGEFSVRRSLTLGEGGVFRAAGANTDSIQFGGAMEVSGTLDFRIDESPEGVTLTEIEDDLEFKSGAELDVGWEENPVFGAWNVTTWKGGLSGGNNLSFASGVDQSVWSFEAVDTQGDDAADTLRVLAVPDRARVSEAVKALAQQNPDPEQTLAELIAILKIDKTDAPPTFSAGRQAVFALRHLNIETRHAAALLNNILKDTEEENPVHLEVLNAINAGGPKLLRKLGEDSDAVAALREIAGAAAAALDLRLAAVRTLTSEAIDAELPSGLADWPMWRYDAARGAETPVELPEDLYLQWVRELPEPRRAWPEQPDDEGKLGFDTSYEPIVAGELMFVPSMITDSVTAYEINTGEKRWRYYTDGPVRIAPAYSGGRLYVPSDDGFLYCLDALSGELLWRFQGAPTGRTVLGNERLISMWSVRGGPVISEGTVYFTAGVWPMEGIFFYALDAESGEVQWENSGIGHEMTDAYRGASVSFGTVAPQGPLAIDGDRLLVPGGRTTPATYDRHTGRLLDYTVVKRDGGYGVSAEGLLPVRGSRITAGTVEYDSDEWSERVDGEVWRLLAAHNRLFVVTEQGRIYCFGAEQREPLVHAYEPKPIKAGEDKWAERVRRMLDDTGAREGYAVMYGVGSGQLLRQLLALSELHIIVFDPDENKVERLREDFTESGLYGRRVAVHQGNALTRPLPPYIASLIVSEDPAAAGFEADEKFVNALFRPLRPYGGTAYLFAEADEQELFAQAVEKADLEKSRLSKTEDAAVLSRPGALPGSDTWTHQYSDAANTAYSDDDRVRAPLGISWFGAGLTNHRTLPRHMNGPVPQVVEGRLIILGVDHLNARCVYTGRQVWSIELPEVGRAFTSPAHEYNYEKGERVYFPSHYGANFRGSPYVSTPDSVYVIHEDRCLRLDLDTGEKLSAMELPSREILSRKAGAKPDLSYVTRIEEGKERRWGHISTSGDYLIIGAYPHMFEDIPDIPAGQGHVRPRPEELWHWSATSSAYLLAMERRTGEIKWVHQARYGFRHNAIATDGGRTFVIDNVSDNVREKMSRRGIEPEHEAVIHALDTESGKLLGSLDEDVFGTWLSYSREHDVLFQAGRPGGRSTLPDEPNERMVAMRGKNGRKLWARNERYTGPVGLHAGQRRTIAGENNASVDLLTGEIVSYKNPLTDHPEQWRYIQIKACGTHNASRHLITFRSGTGAYYDLAEESGTGNLSGFRSGCTNNLVVADGVLNAPEYTRTCSCSYQHQTSLALVHMPDAEMWTFNAYSDPMPGSVKRIGLNLGAPGNRVSDGVMWLNYPPLRRLPAPAVPARVSPVTGGELEWFSAHSLTIKEGDNGYRWVAASGVEGVGSIRFEELINDSSRTAGGSAYRVRLHFAEPEEIRPGQRVFDVLLQDEKVIEELDITEKTGGAKRILVVEIDNVNPSPRGELKLEFVPVSGSEFEPLICGVEVRLEE